MRCKNIVPHVVRTFLLASSALFISTAFAQTYSRTEVITYHDNTSQWVLGQVASVTCIASVPASASCDGNDVQTHTTYDAATALPVATYVFGKLQQTFGYNADGTLKTVKDGRNNTTTFTNWKRGIPQTIQFADGTLQSATVNDHGWVTAVTDENGFTTGYSYDALGRLSGVTYPTGDSTAWAPTTRSFVPVNTPEYGLASGHWRLTESTGNAVKVTYYDGLWRPLLVREYDASNVAQTERFTRTAYDAEGRVSFTSYPSASSGATTGIWTLYDALGRVTSVSQDSEQGLLTTLTEYLPGFQTRVTNPRGFQTVSSYLTYDQPTLDWPLVITAPEGQTTAISRDPYGKPTAIVRGGIARYYGYNANQEPCRSDEPETGTTLYAYDAAGNLSTTAAGLPAGTACGTPNARTVSRSYTARNRLSTLTFPDGNGNQMWYYTPDGLPSMVTTGNGSSQVVNTYAYNKRRLLLEAQQSPAPQQAAWRIGYGYNSLGQRTLEEAPGNVAVTYGVNALGQTTGISASVGGGAATLLASNARYHPNGALAQFTYGNGLVHTMTQNARQLPAQSTDGTVLHLSMAFDPNGNVASVTDYTNAARQTRSMAYDGLDRLTHVSSPMFGTANYGYDPQDNLTRVNLSGGSHARQHYYCYNTRNQLEFIRTGAACSGTTSPAAVALGYDVQGNVSYKNGSSYSFDYGNRLRSTGTWAYRYDAAGRRVRQESTGAGLIDSVYAEDGRLLWQRDEVAGQRINNVYIAGSLLAEIRRPVGSTTVTISYFHTDALGSPIAKTNAAGTVIETSEYEPYGALLNRANDNRVGYTGHVMDSATGLTYMQQRYYDPAIGRFLSVDPVTAYSNPVGSFNRYRYGNSNPYKFTDPDGRQSWPTPQNFNVDMSKRVPNDVSNSWKTAEQAAAPKAVYATGSVGDAAGGGFVGGQAQGASVTGALSLKGASVSGNGPQALLTTPAGAVQLQASRGGIEKQTLNAQVVGASVGLGSYEVGISSLTSASAISNLDTKTTISIPGLSVSWGENKAGAGWAIGISIVKPSASLSFIRTEKPTEP